ncbi:MAG: hypothetical protein CO126_03675 [Hydrogenophilales bacterium CG_4_9_14_3_um_filter_63_34]|nr:MAG: hypothetical protein COZ24_00605 [Hydrogenophilales bacterium CG_4_10_14_3_um_filter_63_21]PJB05254.1 MAG: hypothetical protein CO126_03675 [Hydrogenophilales bacterium CG_4_9_14_3_um_filter_63_34]
MLVALLVATLIALFAGQALPKAIGAAPTFWAHLVLALGVMTLITAAMQHFVPVLTRGRGPGRWTARLPGLMAAAGALALTVFAGWLDFIWVTAAAVLGLVGAVAMIMWMLARARQTLGRPHPGLDWYVAAMACLALGLMAALLIPLLPEWHAPLRVFHLHINLYGFVGLTAVGTLQVLLPTAANLPDPQAASRLRGDLKWALAGSLILAIGQAWLPPFAWLGGALWAWVLGHMGLAWWRLYRPHLLGLHGAAPVLLAATLGFAFALIGTLLEIGSPLTLFLPGFLMPLITGAAGQLAPVWTEPTRPTAWHNEARQRLTRWNGLRAVLFLTAALLPLFGYKCSGMPALTALAWFGIVLALWLSRE